MNLKEYLISIGRLPEPEEEQNAKVENQILEKELEYQNIGEFFNLLRLRHKSFPDNIQINIPGWEGNPIRRKQELK